MAFDPYDDPAVEDGPWFFAWVEPTETTFVEGTHARVDEWVFSVNIEHKEGDNPTATLEIENPGVGLLASGRLGWMWISKRKLDNTIVPLFFGQLLSVPSDMLQTVVTIVMVARPVDQDARKLGLAETLKVAPYYDEVWVDPGSQNDPDTVLEGYSSRWHFDRVTLDVSVSDVLEGEDGTLEFSRDDLFWDGMNLGLDSVPLSSVSVRATVNWTQKLKGTVVLPSRNIETFTGDGILGDWPKPYSSLGGGWEAGHSMCVDVYNTNHSESFSASFNWRSRARKHSNGDMISFSRSSSGSFTAGGSMVTEVKRTNNSVGGTGGAALGSGGVYSVYPGRAPSISISTSTKGIAIWLLSTYLELRAKGERARKEIINFTMVSDVQDVLIPPGKVKANVDKISLNGRDVGEPLYVRASLRGTGGNVANNDEVMISSNTPYRFLTTLVPGEGHVKIGATLADSLQNLVNAINADGQGVPGVDFAAENAPDESVFAVLLNATTIQLTGRSLDDKILVATTSTVLVFESPLTYKWTGANPVPGQTATVGDKIYTFDAELRTGMNQLTLLQTIVVQVPYHVLIEQTLEGTLANFAAAINADGGSGSKYSTGTLMNNQVKAEIINGVLTIFPRHRDSSVTVVGPWALGTDHLVPDQNSVPLPIESARSYLSTDRGQQSVQVLIARARARLRITSRAVKATFVGDFEKCFGLSCRKNAILNDPRFGGGQVTGKVTSYYLKCSGDDGAELAGGEVGCAVGNGNTIVDDPGTPSYVDVGYADTGWQDYDGRQVRLVSSDIWYTPPVEAAGVDDGLTFPLSLSQVLLVDRVVPDREAQEKILQNAMAGTRPDLSDQNIDINNATDERLMLKPLQEEDSLQNALTNAPTVYELTLAPLDGGPFSARYELTVSPLMIPKQVDLAAE